MKNITAFCFFLVLTFACARKQVFQDDEMGAVSRVYKSVMFTANQKQHPAFHDLLTFVRVESTGEVVMTIRRDRDFEVRGKPWSPLTSPEIPNLPFAVLGTSFTNQTAVIEYEAWTSRPRQ